MAFFVVAVAVKLSSLGFICNMLLHWQKPFQPAETLAKVCQQIRGRCYCGRTCAGAGVRFDCFSNAQKLALQTSFSWLCNWGCKGCPDLHIHGAAMQSLQWLGHFKAVCKSLHLNRRRKFGSKGWQVGNVLCLWDVASPSVTTFCKRAKCSPKVRTTSAFTGSVTQRYFKL